MAQSWFLEAPLVQQADGELKNASIGVFFIHSCAYSVTLIFSNFADVVRTTTMAMAGNRMLKAMPVEFPGLRGYR